MTRAPMRDPPRRGRFLRGSRLALPSGIYGDSCMRVIRRAAAFAHSFVSLNYEQAAALKYLVRPASDPQGSGAAAPQTGHGQQGGSMAKLIWLSVATMSVVAVTGTPGSAGTAPGVFDAARQLATSWWVAPGPAFQTPLEGAARWSESGSLLLLASSFFAAAVLLRRRAR
jgi:hypothetical protein